MKVYAVMVGLIEDACLDRIFSTPEEAERRVAEINANKKSDGTFWYDEKPHQPSCGAWLEERELL